MPPIADHTTDLMQGWGSILGAVFTFLTVVAAGLLYWHEVSTRREERLDREIAQARTIIATVAAAPTSRGQVVTDVFCRVENCGGAPIVEVEFAVSRHEREEMPFFIRMFAVIQPGTRGEGRARLPSTMPLHEYSDRDSLLGFQTSITFTDAAGVRWNRLDGMEPTRVFHRPGNRVQRWWKLRRLRKLNPSIDPAKLTLPR